MFGGWSVNWAAVLQGGQPITLSCPSSTTSGTGCYDLIVPGQDQKRGLHIDSNGKLSFFGNPGAFNQPCVLGAGGVPDPTKVVGCVPLTGLAALGGPPAQIAGPTFKRLDFSVFKDMRLSERFTLQFRAEFFNIFNHPNFNAPGFGGNGVVAVSGATNFTELELRRNRIYAGCSLRSQADPVRSEALLLSRHFSSSGRRSNRTPSADPLT